MRYDRFSRDDSTTYSEFARLVRPGEWTTYGDISAAVHDGSKRRARSVARAAATEPDFPNAHRVLGHDGTVVRGPGNDAARRRAMECLMDEGVIFDLSGRADASKRLHWDELQRRSGRSVGRKLPRSSGPS